MTTSEYGDVVSRASWYRPTTSKYLVGLIVVTALLFLSERFRWFEFNRHKGWTVLIACAIVAAALALLLVGFVIAWVSRRKPQFGLATLLLLFVTVALPLSWLAHAMNAARRQSDVMAVINEAGGSAGFEFEGHFRVVRTDSLTPLEGLLVGRLGADFFRDVRWVGLESGLPESEREIFSAMIPLTQPATKRKAIELFVRRRLTPVEINAVKSLPHLRGIYLNGQSVTDSVLNEFFAVPDLTVVGLSSTHVSPAGIRELARLPRLRHFSLGDERMTDEHLAAIGSLSHLEGVELSIYGNPRVTAITDAGLQKVMTLPRLKSLSLNVLPVRDESMRRLPQMPALTHLHIDARITDEGLEQIALCSGLKTLILSAKHTTVKARDRIRKALPNCAVLPNP